METDVRKLHQRAIESFGARVHAIRDDQWDSRTPCEDWDVRTGDLLGDDGKAAWDESAAEAVAAVQADGAMERTVHLSFGDFPGQEYTMQVFADLVVHGWDLARAIGAEERIDPDLVEACASWFGPMEEAYRSAGAVGPRIDTPPDADPQTRLLAVFGRS